MERQKEIKYFSSQDKMNVYKHTGDKLYLMNRLKPKLIDLSTLSEDIIPIRKIEYNTLLNKYFLEQEYFIFKGESNFKASKNITGHLLEFATISGYAAHYELVAFRGELYYFTDGKLYDYETKEFCRYAKLSNCLPVKKLK